MSEGDELLPLDSPPRRQLVRTRSNTDAVLLERHWFLRAVAWILQWWVVYHGLFLLVAFRLLFGLYGIIPVAMELTEGRSQYLRRTSCGTGEYCNSTCRSAEALKRSDQCQVNRGPSIVMAAPV